METRAETLVRRLAVLVGFTDRSPQQTHVAVSLDSPPAPTPTRALTFNWLTTWLLLWQAAMVLLFAFCTLYPAQLLPGGSAGDMGARYGMFQDVRTPWTFTLHSHSRPARSLLRCT